MSKQKDKSQYSLQLAVAAATLGMSIGISPSIVLASPDTGVAQESLQVSDPKVKQPDAVFPKVEQVQQPMQQPDAVFPKVEQAEAQYRKYEQPGVEYQKIGKPGIQFPKTEIVDVSPKVGDVSSDDVPLTPIPPNLEKNNLSGTWNYKTNDGKAGTVKITQKGKDITLVVTSGAKCKPIAVCSYTGTLDGNVATVSNSVIVDKAGGKVISDMVLNISTEKSTILGSSTHDYVHPGGHKMHWNLVYKMIRESTSSIGTLEQMGDDPWVN